MSVMLSSEHGTERRGMPWVVSLRVTGVTGALCTATACAAHPATRPLNRPALSYTCIRMSHTPAMQEIVMSTVKIKRLAIVRRQAQHAAAAGRGACSLPGERASLLSELPAAGSSRGRLVAARWWQTPGAAMQMLGQACIMTIRRGGGEISAAKHSRCKERAAASLTSQ